MVVQSRSSRGLGLPLLQLGRSGYPSPACCWHQVHFVAMKALAPQPAVPVTLWSPGSQSLEAAGFEFLLRVEKSRAVTRRSQKNKSRWVGPFSCIGPAGGGYRSSAKVPENYKHREIRLGKAALGGQHLPLSFAFMNCSLNLCWVLAFWPACPDSPRSPPSTGCTATSPQRATPPPTTLQPQHVQFSLAVKCSG